MKRAKVTLVPLVVAAAAFFVVLPNTGGDAVIAAAKGAKGFTFSPDALTVSAGDRVRIENPTDATHAISALTGAFDLGDLQPGQSRLIDDLAPGSYEFRCRYHGNDGMTGTLTVR